MSIFGYFLGFKPLKGGVKPLFLDNFVFFMYKHIQYLYFGIKILTIKKNGFFFFIYILDRISVTGGLLILTSKEMDKRLATLAALIRFFPSMRHDM